MSDELKACNDKIGFWLSAALEDFTVCEEMKHDIRKWFEVMEAKNTGASDWISVKDRLPFDGEYALVHPVFISSVFDDEPRHVLRFKEGRWVYYLGGSVHTTFGHTVTHWQPLPSPPLEVDK